MGEEKKKVNDYKIIGRIIGILKILKEETDEYTTISQQEIRELMEDSDNSCPERTLLDYLKVMVRELNPQEFNPPKLNRLEEAEDEKNLDINNYKIIVKGLKEKLRAREQGLKEGEKTLKLVDLQFNHTFSFDEINQLIEAVLFLKNINTDEKEILIKKLKTLSSKNYPRYSPYISEYTGTVSTKIQGVFEDSRIDEITAKENLRLIRKAVENNYKIAFHFNGYNKMKELETRRNADGDLMTYIVDPYYVLVYNGKYYLVCSVEPYENISIYRIDLMSDITNQIGVSVLDKEKTAAKPRRKKTEIKGLPKEWDSKTASKFQSEHLYMFYGEPEKIRLKLDRERYTLLHDYFGEDYEFKKSLDCKWDEVEVTCVPEAVMNWAMQCSDYVEILEPKILREKMKTRCESLVKRYKAE